MKTVKTRLPGTLTHSALQDRSIVMELPPHLVDRSTRHTVGSWSWRRGVPSIMKYNGWPSVMTRDKIIIPSLVSPGGCPKISPFGPV
jgi:hypothetical protein